MYPEALDSFSAQLVNLARQELICKGGCHQRVSAQHSVFGSDPAQQLRGT
jgi:hypothetical protein